MATRQEEFDQYESKTLQALPAQMFEVKKTTRAKVQRNYHVILGEDSHQYSVPYQHVGKTSEVVYTANTVEVYVDHHRIAVHSRDRTAHAFTTLDLHRPEKHSEYLKHSEYSSDNLIQQAEAIGPHTRWAIQYIIDHQSGLAQAHNAARATLQLAKMFCAERLEQACQHIRPANTVKLSILRNILNNHMEQGEHISDWNPIPRMHDNVRGASHFF